MSSVVCLVSLRVYMVSSGCGWGRGLAQRVWKVLAEFGDELGELKLGERYSINDCLVLEFVDSEITIVKRRKYLYDAYFHP